MYFTHYYTHDPRVDLDALVNQLNRRMEENGDGELYWFTHRGNVTHSKRSPCGMWVNRCQESFAKELKAIHDEQNEYHQNLPRRLIQEPFWNGFIEKISMRNTCHVDRQIVDSTKFRIPRVRFGYKQDTCLICIYTGIEKFLRLEIQKCGNGVVVFK
ncbi:hypothetical protein L5515_009563 [Caenorhabditis briggsae]|uniref:Uncharacterized protein n=1 Tax=Caenorhabditis briggsae TaxID=6238 RepID=A0AAE9JMF0_CAEBR|nr:hypothetical protein L5515_009563 [Caenorhabditis briggsae]